MTASPDDQDRGVLDLLADIKSGRVGANAISPQTRRMCVEYMVGEGVHIAEIAQLLGRTERTIRRDLDEIRKANALEIDDGFADCMAGELLMEARASVSRIRRVTRERDAPHGARIDGERAIVQILDTTIHRLQSLGYLPSATHHVKAELTHSISEPPPLDEIEAELERLKLLESGSQPDPATTPNHDKESPR